VNARLHPAAFTIRTIPRRFEEMADPVLGALGEGIDVASAIGAIQRTLEPRAREKKRS
jgi:hypothetical protein